MDAIETRPTRHRAERRFRFKCKDCGCDVRTNNHHHRGLCNYCRDKQDERDLAATEEKSTPLSYSERLQIIERWQRAG